MGRLSLSISKLLFIIYNYFESSFVILKRRRKKMIIRHSCHLIKNRRETWQPCQLICTIVTINFKGAFLPLPPCFNKIFTNVHMSFYLDQPVTKKQIINTNFQCLPIMLWSQLKEEETRLVFSRLRQQHKNKHCKLVFSIWFLVTTCSNVKGNSSISVYAIDIFSTCCMYLFSFYRKLSITIITHYSLPAQCFVYKLYSF